MTATVIPFPKDLIKIDRRIGIAREIETMEDILNRWRDQDLQAPDPEPEPMSDWLKEFLRPEPAATDLLRAPWYQEWLAKWYGEMPPTYPRRR